MILNQAAPVLQYWATHLSNFDICFTRMHGASVATCNPSSYIYTYEVKIIS